MRAEPTHCLHYRCPGKGGQCLSLPVPGSIPKHPGSWGSSSQIPQLFPNATALSARYFPSLYGCSDSFRSHKWVCVRAEGCAPGEEGLGEAPVPGLRCYPTLPGKTTPGGKSCSGGRSLEGFSGEQPLADCSGGVSVVPHCPAQVPFPHSSFPHSSASSCSPWFPGTKLLLAPRAET